MGRGYTSWEVEDAYRKPGRCDFLLSTLIKYFGVYSTFFILFPRFCLGKFDAVDRERLSRWTAQVMNRKRLFILNFHYYFLITYGVYKKRKYCNRMIEKEILSFWWMFMFCMNWNTKQRNKNFHLSVCLPICPFIWLYVCMDSYCGHNNFRRS